MPTMNISLPDRLKKFVDDQVASGRYSSSSEYVRELIRHDEEQRAQAKQETLLREGVQSGEPTEMTRQDWEDIWHAALARIDGRKTRKSRDFPDWRAMQGMVRSGPSLTKALEEEHAAELAREESRLQGH